MSKADTDSDVFGLHCISEIMGRSIRPCETNSHEFIHHVDGWEHNINISYYDGWHDVY